MRLSVVIQLNVRTYLDVFAKQSDSLKVEQLQCHVRMLTATMVCWRINSVTLIRMQFRNNQIYAGSTPNNNLYEDIQLGSFVFISAQTMIAITEGLRMRMKGTVINVGAHVLVAVQHVRKKGASEHQFYLRLLIGRFQNFDSAILVW